MTKQQYIWKQQENNEEYKNINAIIYQMVKLSGFVMEPIIWGEVFYTYLENKKSSDKNKQTARNMSKVFAIICQYNFINGKLYKNNVFAISPSIWQKHCIGRNALETSIKQLQEMNLIKFNNRWYKGDKEKRRRVYKINFFAVEFLLKQANRIKDEQQGKDLRLYEDFLDYTNRKDFVNEFAEEKAFKEYKTNRKNGKIKVKDKIVEYLPFTTTDYNEPIV